MCCVPKGANCSLDIIKLLSIILSFAGNANLTSYTYESLKQNIHYMIEETRTHHLLYFCNNCIELNDKLKRTIMIDKMLLAINNQVQSPL